MAKKTRRSEEVNLVPASYYREQAKLRKMKGRTAVLTSDEVDQLEIKALEYKMNLIPYKVTVKNNPAAKPGQYLLYRKYGIHRNVGGPEGPSRICPKTWGEVCEICNYRDTLDYEKDKALRDSLKAQQKALVNVLIEGTNELVYVDHSFATFLAIVEEEILQIENTKGEKAAAEAEKYQSLKDGKYVEVRFAKGKFGGFPFFKVDKVNFVDREDDITTDQLDEALDLDKLLVYISSEQLLLEHNGVEGETETTEQKKSEKDEEMKDEGIDFDSMDADGLLDWADENDIEISRKEARLDEDELRELIMERVGEKEGDPEDDNGTEEEPEEKEIEIPKGMKLCVACNGTGKASNGNKCKPCKGKGFLSKKKDEEEKETEKGKCPFGHRFGKDCEEKDECDNCPKAIWDACLEANS